MQITAFSLISAAPMILRSEQASLSNKRLLLISVTPQNALINAQKSDHVLFKLHMEQVI